MADRITGYSMQPDAIEQQIMNYVNRLDDAGKRKVLEFAAQAAGHRPGHYSARELLKMPTVERDRLVAEAFASAAEEDFETFEAFSEEQIDD
jgi:hypothetical protein